MNMPEVMRHRISSWEYPVCDGREVNQLETYAKKVTAERDEWLDSFTGLAITNQRLERKRCQLMQEKEELDKKHQACEIALGYVTDKLDGVEAERNELMQKYNKQPKSIKPLIESHGKLELENDELRQDCKELRERLAELVMLDDDPCYGFDSFTLQPSKELLTRIGDKYK